MFSAAMRSGFSQIRMAKVRAAKNVGALHAV